MRRSSSEQAPCTLSTEMPDMRSKSFDCGSLPSSRQGEIYCSASAMKERRRGYLVRQVGGSSTRHGSSVVPRSSTDRSRSRCPAVPQRVSGGAPPGTRAVRASRTRPLGTPPRAVPGQERSQQRRCVFERRFSRNRLMSRRLLLRTCLTFCLSRGRSLSTAAAAVVPPAEPE